MRCKNKREIVKLNSEVSLRGVYDEAISEIATRTKVRSQ